MNIPECRGDVDKPIGFKPLSLTSNAMNAKLFELIAFSLLALAASAAEDTAGFVSLFPQDGVPKGWLVRNWDNVKTQELSRGGGHVGIRHARIKVLD